MNTCTVILPIDKKRSMQLLVLLKMFSANAVVPLKGITGVIPKSTFFALLYKLKLLARVVREENGFDLFSFEKEVDGAGRVVKSMRLNSEMRVRELDGASFVVLARKS